MSDKPDPISIQEMIRQVKRRVTDTTNLLRQQKDLLKQRGVNLPSAALDSLRNLTKNVDNLANLVLTNQGELRSLRALAQNAALINSSQTTGEVLNQVIDTVIALTGAERGYIVLKNQATNTLEFTVARGMDQSSLDSKNGLIVSRSIVNRVADTGEPVLTDNASDDKEIATSDSIIGLALRSIMAVPLRVRDEVIGVVYVDNRFLSGLFKASDLQILASFAAQAAVAIENARLFEAARRSVAQITELRDRMRNIFTSIASGIISAEPQGRIIIGNAAAEAALEQTDIAGKNLSEVLPELGEAYQQAVQQALKNGTTQQLNLEPMLKQRKRYWSMNVSPLQNDSGKVLGITLVLDDMTEQKEREAQLAEVRRYLPSALVKNIRSVEEIDVRGQEREITALFADVRGFTSFSEKLQPEELMTIINYYLSLASDAVNLYEGIVDKYMGDAVTGLYNTQLNPQKDHAARAVQSALALVIDLKAQHEVMPESQRLFYGIGVHTGTAVLGNVGGKERKEFAAMGEATIICKYLQEQAGPGEIIISQATYDLVEDQFECVRETEIKRPKEGYEQIAFYRVIKRKKGGLSPFVDQELLDLLNET